MEEEDIPLLNIRIDDIVGKNEIAVESDDELLLSLTYDDIDKILRSIGFYFFEMPATCGYNSKTKKYGSIYKDNYGNVLLLEYELINVDIENVRVGGFGACRHAKIFLNISGVPREVIQEIDLKVVSEKCPYKNVSYDLPTRIKRLLEESSNPRPKDMYV